MFTTSGFLGSSALTSTTSPVTGANRSETAFTDSTTPKVFMATTFAPTFGSSTKTTSPSCSWAKAVMPMRARPSSTLAHSCSRVDLSFGRFPPPAGPGLGWVDGLVDVVAVERVLHLEPQRVARPEPDRLDPVPAPRLEERGPEPLGLAGRHVQLEAVLAGVAGAGDEAGDPGHLAAGEGIVVDAGHAAVGGPGHTPSR